MVRPPDTFPNGCQRTHSKGEVWSLWYGGDQEYRQLTWTHSNATDYRCGSTTQNPATGVNFYCPECSIRLGLKW